MKKLLFGILKLPFFIIKCIMKIILWLLKHLFGFLFGWIPDLNENMSGEDFEEYVQAVLIRNGYKKVSLTKRSGDYGIDILAYKKGELYAFQCKFYQKPVGVSAVQQASAGCLYYNADRAIVVTNQRFTSQAYALAATNQVELWDGDHLEKLKRKANSHSLFHRFSYTNDEHEYAPVLTVLLESGYASDDLLIKKCSYTQSRAHYILEDLEFYGLVSTCNEYGEREIYFDDIDEAIHCLH